MRWIKLLVLVFGLLGIVVQAERYYADRARIDDLTRLTWEPLSANEIETIKKSMAGIRPRQPTMTIQYLDSNAYDLAKSLESLFSRIGFNPKIQLDTIVAVGNGTIKIEADDSDTQMLTKITNSINNITQGRIKCTLTDSKGHGQTRIFIGQKRT